MRGKKGQAEILIGLAIWIVAAIVLTVILKGIASCVMTGMAFVGMLLLVAAVLFGVMGNLAVGGVSGAASAVFLLLSFGGCL